MRTERFARWVSWLGAALLIASASASVRVAHAQLTPSADASSVERRHTFRERDRVRVVIEDAQGALWLEANGRRFPTSLGTDRVLVVGGRDQELSSLELVLDEVLSERADIIAVRSLRDGEGALALAERLSAAVAAGRFEGASPDLALEHRVADIAVPPHDPELSRQWFYETIGMNDAWAREDGDPSVTIAIVDSGCDGRHRDLADHLLPGYDALDDDTRPEPSPDTPGAYHGTACAGLAAAVTDNRLDVAGSCPECSLRCVRLLDAVVSSVSESADVRAFDFVLSHDDVAVASNSWGFAPGIPVPLALETVLRRVMSEGRGGLGTLVVFASGNDGVEIGFDELQAIPGIVVVGATDEDDRVRDYSNFGASLDVVAPTGEVTTDITGADGADPGAVTDTFSGTSSAAPIVAGVLGLLVSAAPTRSGEALAQILFDTARRSPYARSGSDPHYGHGVIDPAAALEVLLPPLDAGVAEDAGPIEPDAAERPDTGPRMLAPRPQRCGCRASRPSPPGLLVVLALSLVGARVGRRRVRRGR